MEQEVLGRTNRRLFYPYKLVLISDGKCAVGMGPGDMICMASFITANSCSQQLLSEGDLINYFRFFFQNHKLVNKTDSSVAMIDGQGIGVRFLAGARNECLARFETGSRTYPVSCPADIAVVWLTTQLQANAQVEENEWSYTFIPSVVFIAACVLQLIGNFMFPYWEERRDACWNINLSLACTNSFCQKLSIHGYKMAGR
jgi:hypothetical protein